VSLSLRVVTYPWRRTASRASPKRRMYVLHPTGKYLCEYKCRFAYTSMWPSILLRMDRVLAPRSLPSASQNTRIVHIIMSDTYQYSTQ
jgi:hypothetical protein